MENIRVRKTVFLTTMLIIPFLAFFLYFLLNGITPLNTIKYLTNTAKPKVKYETYYVNIDKDIPEYIVQQIEDTLGNIKYEDINRFKFVDKDDAKYYISSGNISDEYLIGSKILLPIGHPYWVEDSINTKDLCSKYSIYLQKDNYDVNKSFLNNTFGQECNISEVGDIVSELKNSEGKAIGFVESGVLSKDMKLLKLDGNYYLESDNGSVNIKYGLSSDEENIDFVNSVIKKNLILDYGENIDKEVVAKINMTGVTAITRGLGKKMDVLQDYDYPAKKIGEFLADADLTHVSNEISFVNGCTSYSGMRFCSKPEYIEALKASGVDIVELTGNHNNDYGYTANANTINMYKDLGWDYFGGGLDATDAEKILYKEVKGSKIAFIGYNYFDTMLNSGAIASNTHAGSNSYSVEKLSRDIQEAKNNADIVIVDFQFQECYSYPSSDVIYPICYKPLSNPDQKGVFRKAIDLGADIVIGTQAHQPQTYEMYNDGYIFYGLGNLYFDQINWIGTRQGLVLSLYVYDGKLLQAQLVPTIYDNDMVTRLANEEEGNLLLGLLKSARTF